MKLILEDGSLKGNLPSQDHEIIHRPVGPDEWCLTISEIDFYGPEVAAERFVWQVVRDTVRAARSDWVRVALREALKDYPDVSAPEPFRVVPGGVA